MFKQRGALRAMTFTSTESKSGQTEQFPEKKFCLTQLLKTVIKVPGHGWAHRCYGAVCKADTCTNANGESIERSKHLCSWCHQQKACAVLGLFQAWSIVAECTNAIMSGNPEGYKGTSL